MFTPIADNEIRQRHTVAELRRSVDRAERIRIARMRADRDRSPAEPRHRNPLVQLVARRGVQPV